MKTPDYMTKPGALALADRIRRFWYSHGHMPKVWIEKMDTRAEGEVYVVRSNLTWKMPA